MRIATCKKKKRERRKAQLRDTPGRNLRDSWRENENEGKRKTEMARERQERDVMYVWSRFTLSSPYHETSPGGDIHTAAVCLGAHGV